MAKTTDPPSELVIMSRLDRILGGLDYAARQLVMDWLVAKHDHRHPADRQECRSAGLTPSYPAGDPRQSTIPMPF